MFEGSYVAHPGSSSHPEGAALGILLGMLDGDMLGLLLGTALGD